MSTSPNLWQRASDYFLLRRANQTIIALFVIGALVVVAVWWYRNGGGEGKLTEYDHSGSSQKQAGDGLSANPAPRKADFIVDLNTADVAELIELPGVGQVIAERIVERRKKNGPFQSVDELLEVTGIAQKTLDKIKPHACVK